MYFLKQNILQHFLLEIQIVPVPRHVEMEGILFVEQTKEICMLGILNLSKHLLLAQCSQTVKQLKR